MSEYVGDAIFWIEVEKVKPNPFQPRKEFNEAHLRDLADSIRTYGVLQPLVVTKKDIPREDGMDVEYELIAGERRLRASKLAGLTKVPAIIRQDIQSSQLKLELAIIENLQREDINPVDRAMAFARLVNEFTFTHTEIAKRVGKSREYVSNTLRLLSLPQDILDALSAGKISEGHSRPLMMLNDRPPEQSVLFKDIMYRKLTVREAEEAARHIAKEKVRKKMRAMDPEMAQVAKELTEALGTHVEIESRSVGGKVVIDFFSRDDLAQIIAVIQSHQTMQAGQLHTGFYAQNAEQIPVDGIDDGVSKIEETTPLQIVDEAVALPPTSPTADEPDLYAVKNFNV